MKCYYHHDRDAFGICSNCGKGLCLECMEESGNRIVCKGNDCKNKLNNLTFWQIVMLILLALTVIILIMD